MSIPLGPFRLPEEPPGDADRRARSPGQPGLFRRTFRGIGWLLGGPGDWLGRRAVARGGADIAALARALRQPSGVDPRLFTDEEGGFDLAATAFSYGIRVEELRLRLVRRRRQTARLAWSFWAIAATSFGAWLWVALGTETTAMRWLSMLQFLPFVVLFALLGVREALTNYQIRVLRAAGVREWLVTDDRFWPG